MTVSKTMSLRPLLLACCVPAMFAFSVGCSKGSESNAEAARCTLDEDCDSGSYCASDGTCNSTCGPDNACTDGKTCTARGRCEDLATPCELASDCTMHPGGDPYCDGSTSIVPGNSERCALPEGAEERVCIYNDERVVCLNGCNEDTGECNPEIPDPCEGISCDMPEANSCKDSMTLIEYNAQGICDEGECSYQSREVNCPTGCENGACNAGVCEEGTCDEVMPSAAICSSQTPDLAISYGGEASCVEDMGMPKCEFEASYELCTYTGASCSDGACVDAIAQSGEVIVSEYMVIPAGDDSEKFSKQWIELYNTTDAAIELQGWSIEYQTQSQTHVIAPGDDGMGSLVIEPKSHLLISNGSDPLGDGTAPDYRYSDILLGYQGKLLIKDGAGAVVDYLFWENGSTTDASARQIKAGNELSATANDSPDAWCPNLSDSFGSTGGYGTPGATNSACSDDPCAGRTCDAKPESYCKDLSTAVAYTVDAPVCQVSRFGSPYCDYVPMEQACEGDTPYCLSGSCIAVPDNIASQPGQLIITEVMGDPSGTDTEREWIEVYNTTDSEVSLFTLKVEDNEEGNKFSSVEILDPSAVVPARGYAVLATNVDSMINGGIENAYVLGKGVLKNTPDVDMATGVSVMKLRLVTADDMLIDEAYYGTPVSGEAQQLSLSTYTDAGVTDFAPLNDTEANFCLATVDYGMMSGKGSPGAANEECP